MRHGTNFVDVDIKCPYYHVSDVREIVCEGLQKNTLNVLRFGRKEYCREYMREFCTKDYKQCEICRAASHKYI